MAVAKQAEINPAEGKLGVLLVGLGAVSTTFIAGVEAIKKGFAQPIGSLTQMGTIRLGKRTENRRKHELHCGPDAAEEAIDGRRARRIAASKEDDQPRQHRHDDAERQHVEQYRDEDEGEGRAGRRGDAESLQFGGLVIW